MAEYIEREVTQNEIKKLCDKYNLAYGEQYGGFAEKIANITNTIPTADVQEVRHGKWKYDPNAVDFGIGGWICSCCSARNNNLAWNNRKINPHVFAGSNYCPNCGAKMNKE